jgi:CRISPR system Cascade subunit CasC
MWIELHMLQNFAPSCLNRDDTNSPKDCVFGDYRRARISSQCLKRATRTHPAFEDAVESAIGLRTKRLAGRLTDVLAERDRDEDAARIVSLAVVNAVIGKMSGDQTSVLVYLGEDEIERIADLIDERWEDVADITVDPEEEEDELPDEVAGLVEDVEDEFTPATNAADVALFGRMVAESTDWNIDAACQVAHAISTHRAEMEMDFYTAVDDLNPGEETGAGMMGTVEFNSSCFYRYALIDLDQLITNLDDDEELALAAVDGFIRAAVAAIPTGKQNSMAAQNPPSLAFAVVKDKSAMPWSLANAFEVPVSVGRSGKLVDQSAGALAKYWDRLATAYGTEGIEAAAVCQLGEADLGPLAEHQVDSMSDVYAAVNEAIAAGDS